MPTFEQLILSPPAGFVASCLEINALVAKDEEKLKQITQEAWRDVLANTSTNDRVNEDVQNIKKGVTTIIRTMKAAQPSASIANAAKILLASTLLTQQSVETVLLQVKELSKSVDPELSALVKQTGKLSNFQWKIGVALTSNICKSLFDPFISIRFDVVKDDGSSTAHTAELTFEQFRELKTSLEKAARAMDSI